jgi:hypothetical protein
MVLRLKSKTVRLQSLQLKVGLPFHDTQFHLFLLVSFPGQSSLNTRQNLAWEAGFIK